MAAPADDAEDAEDLVDEVHDGRGGVAGGEVDVGEDGFADEPEEPLLPVFLREHPHADDAEGGAEGVEEGHGGLAQQGQEPAEEEGEGGGGQEEPRPEAQGAGGDGALFLDCRHLGGITHRFGIVLAGRMPALHLLPALHEAAPDEEAVDGDEEVVDADARVGVPADAEVDDGVEGCHQQARRPQPSACLVFAEDEDQADGCTEDVEEVHVFVLVLLVLLVLLV